MCSFIKEIEQWYRLPLLLFFLPSIDRYPKCPSNDPLVRDGDPPMQSVSLPFLLSCPQLTHRYSHPSQTRCIWPTTTATATTTTTTRHVRPQCHPRHLYRHRRPPPTIQSYCLITHRHPLPAFRRTSARTYTQTMPTWQTEESRIHPPPTQRLHAVPRRLCAPKACPRIHRDESWLVVQDHRCVFCALRCFHSYRTRSDRLSLIQVNVGASSHSMRSVSGR